MADSIAHRHHACQDCGIEIGAAFGPLQGKMWRIGTMSYSAQLQNVPLCLTALEAVLRREGRQSEAERGWLRASSTYRASGEAEAEVTESVGAAGIRR